jgi:hypothetical protein
MSQKEQTVRVYPKTDEKIEDAAKRAVKIAKSLEQVVTLKHNDIEVKVYPTHVDQIVEKWTAANLAGG